MKEEISLFVPGRLCLFGEHSDWAGRNKTFNADIVPGCAIVTGTQQGIYAVAGKSDEFIVRSDIAEYKGDNLKCEMELKLLRDTAQKGGFFSYVAGVASYICEWYHTGGVEICITKMDLPMKSGLSSSAAICVLVAKAFNELYDLRLNTMGLMNIAYWGELRTPSRCGRLDQACAFGVNPVAVGFDGDEISVERISLKAPLYYVFADLMAEKDTVKILADLNSAYPFPRSREDRLLHEALGVDNRLITSQAIKYMNDGDAEGLGRLMTEAQALFDKKVAPMSSELTAPILHKTLKDDVIRGYTYGGKGVGSQGDGTVQFLAKDEACQKALINYCQKELGMVAYALTLKPKAAVRKAVIPVAGFGTRLFPWTRGIKKEFCPIIDNDGLVKPAIMVLLEELDDIEIEKICLVINTNEKEQYENFFFKSISNEHYEKLSLPMRKYEKRIKSIASKIEFVYQDEQKGFGHAVYQAEKFANGDPVLLLLGDTIYRSNNGVPCTKQLIEVYKKQGLTTVALHSVQLNTVGNYGIFAGEWEDIEESVMKIDCVCEKPTVSFAKENLSMQSRKKSDNYYAAFGAYILRAEVFERLGESVHMNSVNQNGEIDLTDALSFVSKSVGVCGAVVDGESFDLGNPEAYRHAMYSFGR